MDRGELVPDDTVVGVVEQQLATADRVRSGFVLDGFPRTRRQAEELHRILEGHPLDLALDLDVPTEVVLHRIAGRRVCIDAAPCTTSTTRRGRTGPATCAAGRSSNGTTTPRRR